MTLGRFLAARLATAAIAMAIVALITFVLLGEAPGSYLDELASNPQISSATIGHLRDQYGLDQPFYSKFWHWISGVFAGDFGYSFVYQRPVRQLVAERVWNTILLNVIALAVSWGAGVLLGAAASLRPRGVLDWAVGTATASLSSIPTVVLAVALLAWAARIGLPIGGMTPGDEPSHGLLLRLLDLGRHLLLPVIAVTTVWLPVIARHTRTVVTASLAAPHMLAARARGLGRRRLLLTHVLRDALGPLTGLLGLSLSALLSASLVVEVVMAWPGIGQLTYDAVLKRDIFLVVDLVQLTALLLLAGNVIGDVLLRAVDPRIAAR